jgi:serine phosphatase RsbU (regulator of sigma subunit)
LNKDDFEFLNNISGQIFVAIENSFLYEDLTKQERIKHELEIARKIQLASLPNTIPNISGLEISGISLPALEVGGDFYDFLETENGDFMVIIGDVSGKGTSAALYMSKIQGVMRTLYEFRLSPRQLFIRTNHLLYRYLEKGFFISAMSINFVTGTNKAYVSRAGHLPLYLYQSELYNVETLTTKGMVLGLTRDKVFERNMEEDEIHYKPGDIFVLVTDGIIEAKNSILQEYGEENLINVIKQNASKSAEEIRNMILDSVRTFAGNESQYDDVTVVIVKII